VLAEARRKRGSTNGSSVAHLFNACGARSLFDILDLERSRKENLRDQQSLPQISGEACICGPHTPGIIAKYITTDGRGLLVTLASVHSLFNIVRQQQRAKWLGYCDNVKDTTYKVLRDKAGRFITSTCHDANGHAHLISITLSVAESS